jgi:hypothetical protein
VPEVGLLLDFTIGVGGLFAVLVLLMQFTPFIAAFHTAVIGFGMFLLVLLAGIYVFLPDGGTGSRSGGWRGSETPDTFYEVAARINELLEEDAEWEKITIDPGIIEFDSEEFIHKKTKELRPHWSFLSELKNTKLDVRVIYDVKKDDIRQWTPNPSPERRRDLFAGYDPVRLQRLMSRSYEDDEEDEQDAVEVNFSARSSPQRRTEDEDGW